MQEGLRQPREIGDLMSQDSTRTLTARTQSKASRVDVSTRAAQARLADKSFTEFMRKHNAQQKGQ